MLKYLISLTLACCLFCALSQARADVNFSPAPGMADTLLDFTPERTTWEHDYLKVWGTVTNRSNTSYTSIKVTFSLRNYRGSEQTLG